LDHGDRLAFLRQINGRKRLFVRDLTRSGAPDQQLTTPTSPWNVEEAGISPGKSLVVSATKGDASSRLYEVHGVDQLELIPAGEARYPAISPDGRWLAFSIFRSGYWNLSLRDLSTGASRRLTNVSCDQTAPAWLPDSKTLLYASDCGRPLGFTVICKRRFLP
jgi:Tol biopolymer transport system component